MREQQDQGEEDLAERTGVSVCRIERLLEAIPTSAAHVASHRTVKHPSAGANPEKPRQPVSFSSCWPKEGRAGCSLESKYLVGKDQLSFPFLVGRGTRLEELFLLSSG